MSYILDALRRADAQRESDPARGIHAQPMLQASAVPGARRGAWAWRVALAAAAVVLLAAIAWVALRAGEAPVAPRVALPAAPSPATAAPQGIVPGPAPAGAVMPPAPAGPPPAWNSARVGEAVELLPTRRAPAPAASASSASAEMPLPADGAGMPKLAITGGVYSEAPAQRMLIVNGQVLYEGGEAAPGVTLVQIRPRTAVLSFRGQRYTVGY